MTIPDIGHCAGSGAQPLDDSTRGEGGQRSGVCGACSGRFDLRDDGTISLHDVAAVGDREARGPEADTARDL